MKDRIGKCIRLEEQMSLRGQEEAGTITVNHINNFWNFSVAGWITEFPCSAEIQGSNLSCVA